MCRSRYLPRVLHAVATSRLFCCSGGEGASTTLQGNSNNASAKGQAGFLKDNSQQVRRNSAVPSTMSLSHTNSDAANQASSSNSVAQAARACTLGGITCSNADPPICSHLEQHRPGLTYQPERCMLRKTGNSCRLYKNRHKELEHQGMRSAPHHPMQMVHVCLGVCAGRCPRTRCARG